MERNLIGANFKFGILGGGQLGRMVIQEALRLNIDVHIMDSDPLAPCSKIATSFTCGDIKDFQAVYDFGKKLNTLSVEIENVNIEALYKLESEGVNVFPQPRVLEIIKDKGIQKQFFSDNCIPTAPFKLWSEKEGTLEFDLPFVQKMRTGGYDGKGVQIIRQKSDLEKCFSEDSVIEELIPFQKELSVIVARNASGQLKSYPVVECEFNSANLVEYLFAPADISSDIEEGAKSIAENLIQKLDMVGLLAVELFLTHDQQLLVNEIAPRPHNSGHHTIECNETSQFQQYLRAVLDLPLGSTDTISSGAMLNITGEYDYSGEVFYTNYTDLLRHEGVHLHLYGKATTKANRKMGHITISGKNMSEVQNRVQQIKGLFKAISQD
jgi:5-(carboxyamino)imidazole ribonucleotide synthase